MMHKCLPEVSCERLNHLRNHPLSMYATFSEKLTLLTPLYAHVRIRNVTG